jgi:hypothetical protein
MGPKTKMKIKGNWTAFSVKFSTPLDKVNSLQSKENASIIMDFYNHMCKNVSS